MNSHELAQSLIKTRTKRQRDRIMAKNRNVDNVGLARNLKDICVENWAAKPNVSRRSALILGELASESRWPEIIGYSEWTAGLANVTRGRLETAVEHLQRATENFVKAGKTYESAQPQIAALVALAMLGRYEQIPALGRRALRILETHGDQLSAGKVEINLLNVAFQLGRYRQAEKLGLSALRRFKSLKATAWAAMVENGLANTYAALNDFRSAERLFRAALESACSTGKTVTEAEVEASIGNLELSRGRYAKALQFFERSRKKFDELKMPHKSAIADLEIAEIYSELNLSSEALELLFRIVGKLSRLKMQSEEARARFVLGKTAIRQKKVSLARKELKKASRLYELEKNRTKWAVVTVHRAMLELSLGRFELALQFAKRSETVFKKTGNGRENLMATWILGELLVKTGNIKSGMANLGETLADALRFEQKNAALLSLNSIGNAQVKRGDLTAAKRAFTRAVTLTESSRALLPGEEFRIAFLEGKLEPFNQLAKISLAQNRIQDAFAFVERAKSRSLLESMNGSFRDAEHSDKNFSETDRIREELNWFYSRSRTESSKDETEFQREITRLERRLSDMQRREQSLGKTSLAKRRAITTSFDMAKTVVSLGRKRALINYVNFDGNFSAFVLTSEGLHFRADLSSEKGVAEELEQLTFQFGALRYGRQAISAFADQLKRRADAALARLYELLISPLESLIGDRDLVIVPHGTTHYVPFSALRNGSGYLVQTRKVTMAPSASIWHTLTCRPELSSKSPLLVGFADEAVPEVEREVKTIAKMLPQATVFTGKTATFSNFRENAGRHDLIHIACHGRFRADNPLYSSLQLVDGLVNVRDISSLRINASLVVLSACETGLNKIYPGEEIVGLTRGFISAGAKSLILSLWTVNDAGTKRFMREFYSNLQRGDGVDASLRLTQIKFIEEGEHPYYWSPFCCIG